MNDFLVSHNVQMSENATISWSQVSNKPYIPQTASDIGALPNNSPRLTYIDAYGIYTGTIRAEQITAGTISADRINGGTLSGVTINVDTNAKVGDSLYLGVLSDYGKIKSIFFNGAANISGGFGSTGADIEISAATLWLDGTKVIFGDSAGNRATVDFTGCTVKGLNVVAKFG